MRYYNTSFICSLIVATVTVASPIAGPPTSPSLVLFQRDTAPAPSSYPYGNEITNEMRWYGWDPNDTGSQRDDGRKIHDAHGTMKQMAFLALHEANAKTKTFKRWFAVSDAHNVQKVFEKIIDWSEEFQPRMKERILMRDDFGRLCRQGQGPAGYSSAATGRHHFCPFGIAQRDMATMVCADLDKPGTGPEYMSSAKIRTLSGTMLHEAVHWVRIGDDALGQHIDDIAGGNIAYQCTKFLPREKLFNAQNYAFFASEAFMQARGCDFADPIPSASNDMNDDGVSDQVSDEVPNGPPPVPSQDQNQGRALVVGLEQVATPYCETFPVPGINQPLGKACKDPVYANRYFFYSLNHIDKVPSLCTSKLDDFYQDDQGRTTDEKLFENPTWPGGSWNLTLFGEKFSYKNDGKTAGGLWKGDRKIDCNGDLKHHDPQSDTWCENSLTKSDGKNRKRRRLVICKW